MDLQRGRKAVHSLLDYLVELPQHNLRSLLLLLFFSLADAWLGISMECSLLIHICLFSFLGKKEKQKIVLGLNDTGHQRFNRATSISKLLTLLAFD